MLKQTLSEQAKAILQHLFEPSVINYYVRQTDLFDLRVINYMEQHDSFELLETKVIDRIIRQMWESNVDDSASFFGHSICYKILKKSSPDYPKDYLRTHWLRWGSVSTRHHPFTMLVYLKSMNIRYYMELFLFLTVMVIFQVFILQFITSWQSFADTGDRWTELFGKRLAGTITKEETQELEDLSSQG